MSRHNTIFALFIIFSAFPACKKSGGGTTTKPTQTGSACQLTDETTYVTGSYEHYWYTYTKDGQLDSIYYSQVTAPGVQAYCKEDADGFIWTTYNTSDPPHPNLYDYLYDGATQDSAAFPNSLATSVQLGTQPNESSYGFTFTYKSAGIFDGAQETAPFPTGTLSGVGVEYNSTGDIGTMTYNTITGPRATSTVTASSYDGHPSPYSGISGWVFLTPAVQWVGSVYEPLLYALSPHNPGQSQFDNGSGKWLEVMTYTYNVQGFPTTRTVVISTPTGTASTYTDTYAYTCH